MSASGLNDVKLSDLGMSRTLTSSYYRKTAKYKVPAKWMAPESLFENISTHASDVWSSGVLMWEVTSFGSEPYYAFDAEQAVRAIAGGYRMARPEACSTELFVGSREGLQVMMMNLFTCRYDVMLQCWQYEMLERPTFRSLVGTLQDMMDEESSL